jgi:SAM-dependent methyltransferase
MSDWTAGYVADIGYTFGYYQELNPARVKLALLNAGIKAPAMQVACELGFGQGLSINLHAATSDVQWFGTDFNPAQAGFAQELAAACGSGAQLFDQAFAEFSQRSDLPEFDFIGLHGIWSWISDENRSVIVDFVRRKLKVGGVLYISYNTLPGWAAFAPMRHLMTEHSDIIGAEGLGIVNRINDALEFADKLLDTQPLFARANPLVAERIKKLKEQNRHYLAHEYFNRDWHPMHFATMAQWLAPAKLQYACSAHYLDFIDAINLTNEQQAFLKDIPDPIFRESVRDFMVNQQFRRDYWVKGARSITPLEQAEALLTQMFVLATPIANISLKVTGAMGEATLAESVYQPLLSLMADYRVRTVKEMHEVVHTQGVSEAQLRQAVLVLAGLDHFLPVQEEAVVNAATSSSIRLNQQLMKKSRSQADTQFLASPLTGSGVHVSQFEQMFLLAIADGAEDPAQWAAVAWAVLSQQGQRIIKDGVTLESAEQNLAELNVQALAFKDNKLPKLKALGVIQYRQQRKIKTKAAQISR